MEAIKNQSNPIVSEEIDEMKSETVEEAYRRGQIEMRAILAAYVEFGEVRNESLARKMRSIDPFAYIPLKESTHEQ